MATINEFKEELIANVRKKVNNKATEDVTIKIDKEDIKQALGKKRLHDSVVTNIKNNLTSAGFEVKENCESTVCVTIPKEKINNNVIAYKDLITK